MNDIVKLAVDGFKGRVEKYSVAESQETLRQALIAANNGKDHFDFRDIRDGKCTGLFSLIEEILVQTVPEGLMESDFFHELVDYRNIAEGDQNLFEIEDSELFVVAKAADGTQAIRRQRLGGISQTSIPTQMRYIRIYEELNRVLAGRVDFNKMIQKVSASFRNEILEDSYQLWDKATSAHLGSTYALSGSFDEEQLMELIAHVEAVSGQEATIIGTKNAVRHLNVAQAANIADAGKNDLYNMGYYGRFYGTPVVGLKQRHKINSLDFKFNDNQLIVAATGVKPIKFIYEGTPLVMMGNPMDNMDLTQEFLYGEKWGTGIILSGGSDGGHNMGIAKYDITSWTTA